MKELISSFFGVIVLFPLHRHVRFSYRLEKEGESACFSHRSRGRCDDAVSISCRLCDCLTIFGEGSGIYLASTAVIIAIIHVVIERLKVKEFRIMTAVRRTWRFYFLLLASPIFLLLITGSCLEDQLNM